MCSAHSVQIVLHDTGGETGNDMTMLKIQKHLQCLKVLHICLTSILCLKVLHICRLKLSYIYKHCKVVNGFEIEFSMFKFYLDNLYQS